MPSTTQNAQLLQKLKDMNLLKLFEPQNTAPAPTPDSPVYPNQPNPRLRTPMPALAVFQPDTQRQFHNPAIPQTRMMPQTAGANSGIGSSIQSQINPSTPPTITISPFSPPVGQFYEINGNGIFEQIFSVNGTPV